MNKLCFYRFGETIIRNVVDIYNYINIILHGKFNRFSNPIEIYIADQFCSTISGEKSKVDSQIG